MQLLKILWAWLRRSCSILFSKFNNPKLDSSISKLEIHQRIRSKRNNQNGIVWVIFLKFFLFLKIYVIIDVSGGITTKTFLLTQFYIIIIILKNNIRNYNHGHNGYEIFTDITFLLSFQIEDTQLKALSWYKRGKQSLLYHSLWVLFSWLDWHIKFRNCSFNACFRNQLNSNW